MDFMDYVKPELLVLIPVLYLLGAALKKSATKDKYIPWVLGAAGVILAAIYVLATSSLSGAKGVFEGIFAAITQGALCAGASVYVNQIVKQASKDE